jgi:kynurenine formamidase
MQRVELIDLSALMSEGMPRYPADWLRPLRLREVRPQSMPEARWKRRFTEWELNAHTGTHVEAADHVFGDGRTLERLPLRHFMGVAYRIDLTDYAGGGEIAGPAVRHRLETARIPEAAVILLHTGYNDRAWGTDGYWTGSPWLSLEAARAVRALRPVLVGLDFQTEQPGESEFNVHRILATDDTVLCEYLFHLDRVQSGRSLFVALPLRIQGVEASPVRAVILNGLVPSDPEDDHAE